MRLFDIPFNLANEVVKRSINDNRRIVERPINGGNNIFYLGATNQFLDRFDEPIKLKLQDIKSHCETKFNDRTHALRTLQRGEGLKTKHVIDKSYIESLLPFLEAFLTKHKKLYHNPNLNVDSLRKRINNIDRKELSFYSDLTFIRDSNQAKPYFKWFNYPDTVQVFELIQEFFIPSMSSLNFELISFANDVIEFEWKLTYSQTVINSLDNPEKIILQTIDNLPINESIRKTIREGLIKLRIGQSQFRTNLVNSDKSSCLFTGIVEEQLLIASHIKPWSCSDDTERIDIANGILLTPTFDKLFDRFLITFDESGSIVWTTNRLSKATIERLSLGIVNKHIHLVIDKTNQAYLNFHRSEFNRLENIE